MKLLRSLAAIAALLVGNHVFAADKTVTLDVPGMYCEICPFTVKKALSKVPGVSNVTASYERKQAVVTFDDSKTSVAGLTAATANAGYPSKPRQ